jgi:hypothetical protein
MLYFQNKWLTLPCPSHLNCPIWNIHVYGINSNLFVIKPAKTAKNMVISILNQEHPQIWSTRPPVQFVATALLCQVLCSYTIICKIPLTFRTSVKELKNLYFVPSCLNNHSNAKIWVGYICSQMLHFIYGVFLSLLVSFIATFSSLCICL